MLNDLLAGIDARLTLAVERKLGVSVRLVGHRPTGVAGQTEPVFDVPSTHEDEARALGLVTLRAIVPPYAVRQRLRDQTVAVGRTK